ncbi:hypothetical protein LSH36_814g03061 [Paralvinella palmiformis]|uniref:Ribonuclease n=1 Tax=Paralvinella palmiformis TaxID=53620 RepID=A0AAD9MTQ7_9ANNE|nr:hypothetical protein LSH36_814g03061 [Paralvinella palmiformis]
MDISSFEKDNRVNSIIKSAVPEVTKDEPCCLGIDEAGRGPVLGPMVYGTSFCPVAIKDEIRELGLADSKTLTEEKRDEIFDKIHAATDKIGWIVHILSPNYISNSMLRRFKYNLNALSHDTAIGLIKMVIDSGVNLKEVYVDTVGDPDKYQAKLKDLFPNLDIVVAKKADATYAIVGAASICAKVCRDKAVKRWHFLEDLDTGSDYSDYGSGYPGDDKTKKFLSDTVDPIFGFPTFARFSWSTADVILSDKAVAVHWEDDDEDGDSKKRAPPKGVPSITSFFQANKSSVPARHHYFTDRCLELVHNF